VAPQKKKKIIRTAAGTKWDDPTLLEWDPNDYRSVRAVSFIRFWITTELGRHCCSVLPSADQCVGVSKLFVWESNSFILVCTNTPFIYSQSDPLVEVTADTGQNLCIRLVWSEMRVSHR